MKRRTKLFLIICASIFFLGISFTVTGLALGASVNDLPSRFSWMYRGQHTRTSENVVAIEGQHITGTRNLSIDIDALSIIIEATDGTDIIVDTSTLSQRIADEVIVEETGDRLEIYLNRSHNNRVRNLLGNNRNQGDLIIGIPRGHQFDQLKLDLGAGSVNAEELSALSMDLRVGAGRLEVRGLQADSLSLDVGAGEANLSNIIVHDASVEGGVGSIRLQGDVTNHIALHNGIGEITFVASGSETDYNYNISTGIGEIVIGSRSYRGLGNDRSVNNNASRSIEVQNGIGRVDIQFER